MCRPTTPPVDEALENSGEQLESGVHRRATPMRYGRVMLFAAFPVMLVFVLGIGNFTAHKAVISSNHPALAQMPWYNALGGRFSLGLEFLILLGAMLLAAGGSLGWVLGYVLYSVFNFVAAWLILKGKV